MNRFILFLSTFYFSLACFAADPDILVTQECESFKVFGLDITSGEFVYYSLSDAQDAPLQKILKKDVLIIKKADGARIDFQQPSGVMERTVSTSRASAITVNPDAHDPVTYPALESDFVLLHHDKTKYDGFLAVSPTPAHDDYYILAGADDDSVLNFRLLSREGKTLALTRPRDIADLKKNGKSKSRRTLYEGTSYVIPEYISVGDEIYTVTEIDSLSFYGCKTVEKIVFPSTLKKIGAHAFRGKRVEKLVGFAFDSMNLRKLILPEGLESVGMYAFCRAGGEMFDELYIPKSLTDIGEFAFGSLGPKTSYRGYYQGNLTSLPDFISTGNCTLFGIDEEAVEVYEKRNKQMR